MYDEILSGTRKQQLDLCLKKLGTQKNMDVFGRELGIILIKFYW